MEIKAKKTWDARLARPAAACTSMSPRDSRSAIDLPLQFQCSVAHCLLRWSGWWYPCPVIFCFPASLPSPMRTSSVSLPLLAGVFVLCPRVDVDLETPAPQEENVPRPALGLLDG